MRDSPKEGRHRAGFRKSYDQVPEISTRLPKAPAGARGHQAPAAPCAAAREAALPLRVPTPMSKLRLRILAAGWLAWMSAGMVPLAADSGTRGAVAPSPKLWPAGASFLHDLAQPTFALSLHPQCPCSRATIAELEMLMAQVRDPLRVQVTFEGPVVGKPVGEPVCKK